MIKIYSKFHKSKSVYDITITAIKFIYKQINYKVEKSFFLTKKKVEKILIPPIKMLSNNTCTL